MDINLPGMNGIDAVKLLANDPRTAHIPVIALTANAMRHQIDHLMAAGMDDHVGKPLDVAELLGALDRATRLDERPPRLQKAQ